jgi:dihydrodipicolinate synthase/N-acetylneuraminate lyase
MTAISSIRGVSPVMAVPFTSGGDVDLSGFRALAKHVLESGVTSSMLFGFASEFYKLADEERVALSDSFLEATRTRGDVTAIVSVTDHATEVAIRRAKESVDAGADALNLLPPYMLAPSRDAVLNHVAAVLEAVEAPVIVQLAPALTGLSLEASTLVALARSHPNLSMVKVESIPPGRVISELAAAEPPIPALVGYAGVQLPDALRRGVAGVQPGSSFPEIYLAIWRAWAAGETDEALQLHRRLLPYISYWMQNVELVVQAEKTILARRGIIATDRCRKPGWTLDRDEQDMIDRFLKEFASFLN